MFELRKFLILVRNRLFRCTYAFFCHPREWTGLIDLTNGNLCTRRYFHLWYATNAIRLDWRI